MDVQGIITAIDEEIARLQQVKTLLGGVTHKSAKTAKTVKKTKRTVSPEALERMKAAQKKRWAKVKRAAKKAEKTAVVQLP